jgi:hypothetical protein
MIKLGTLWPAKAYIIGCIPMKNEILVRRVSPDDFPGDKAAAKELLDRISVNDGFIGSGVMAELSRGSVLIQQERVNIGDGYETWRTTSYC